ncbi:NPCBM/NEW2 domain-containing protein [Pengzhenrongella frigida]|uniref:Uncharacterized protein n=1 Tax=Pengzhenrongella frigida TaxID=1259133 RepID=A0A4Q5N3L4_9MICO|nr:NPCBM/NEW2 domain-containing protein [Cellulomonas sp. HLT2-17]RYV52745.1 hypothetical protein EUA98_02090 [Cellulomonas sp. HLT2-17]
MRAVTNLAAGPPDERPPAESLAGVFVELRLPQNGHIDYPSTMAELRIPDWAKELMLVLGGLAAIATIVTAGFLFFGSSGQSNESIRAIKSTSPADHESSDQSPPSSPEPVPGATETATEVIPPPASDTGTAEVTTSPAFLIDMPADSSSSDPLTLPRSIAGESFVRSVSAATGGCVRDQSNKYEYDLSADFSTFDATIGLDDSSDTSARVLITVRTVNDLIFEGEVGFGTPVVISKSVKGELRLVLEQRYIGPEPNLCTDRGYAVWGNARVTP